MTVKQLQIQKSQIENRIKKNKQAILDEKKKIAEINTELKKLK